MSYHREGADMTKCRDCGTKFNLNSVPYYDNQCQRCRSNDGKPAMCPTCGDEFDAADGVQTTHIHTNGRLESITVCSQECADDTSGRGRR